MFTAKLFMLTVSVNSKVELVDFDYTEYLGPNYKQEIKEKLE